jgi:hypothetical protein
VKFFDEAQKNIADLHLSRSDKQFDALALIMLRHWELKRESTLSNWFRVEYLTSPYNRWGITASGIPGSDPNSNTIESSHRDDKRDKFGQDGKDDVVYFYFYAQLMLYIFIMCAHASYYYPFQGKCL